ncbi:DUF411 domain-containing protein [Aliivibrio fischeri]|uniref:DUF411 domain-containing protein n=1 Tax=Aliivibrio fischeri TaxID=668 RepID=UPI0007C4E4FE|nr:DUF411 domain-containing protein [Aliivibrio fischeri]MCE7534328.1 DUF411 domain-containing protein [Aliivibrio fischeri]MCE7557838.1 DUF411 domain-containing protein [Aliivibrio fischeri]MUK41791.1 DUF411 domain-containing protein [Aliivibrio fischeri]TDM53808.1 DUF411 domain-containing protein [Aliivibrio fischeri]
MKNVKKIAFTSLMLISSSAFAATEVTSYKSPYCGCCTEWEQHMKDNGYDVTTEKHEDMSAIKKKLGVDPRLTSCHTAVIDGYVFEGHIPASDIKEFLADPRDYKGLAVPGMPMGSPGMEYGDKKDKYQVVAFKENGKLALFNTHN